MHGQFSAAMLDFVEKRPRNVASPFAAIKMCEVATGLLVLLKATSRGQDLLPIVRKIGTYDWNLPTLRRKLDFTIRKLGDQNERSRII
jgi:hypothetical protein